MNKNKTFEKTNRPTLGLLGGGQLARMLALKAHELGLKVCVLSQNPDDPAAQVVQNWIQGDPNHLQSVTLLFQQVDIVTFESEFIKTDHLTQLAHQHKTAIHPSPDIMATLRDRWSQKQWLLEGQLPTAHSTSVSSLEDLKTLAQEFDYSFVLKKRLFGYDGYGTYVCQNPKEFKQMAQNFELTTEGYIIEEFIPFRRELAIMCARSASNEVTFLPLVETVQKKSKCFSVKGPVQHSKISGLKRKIKKHLNDSNYIGIIAFELFDYRGQLLINEVAPRVHNSAHYSIDALEDDQFTLHWKALLNSSLNKPYLKNKGFAMVNLIGSHTKTPQWTHPEKTHLHWYGKHNNRPGRKMGHINAVANSPHSALKLALQSLERFKL